MTMDVNEKLAQFLREGQNWEKKPTNILGASLLKLLESKQGQPSIAIEINLKNADTGSATKKRRGIIIRSGSELEQFNQLLSNSKVVQLATNIDHVNPENKEDTTKRNIDTDVFEI